MRIHLKLGVVCKGQWLCIFYECLGQGEVQTTVFINHYLSVVVKAIIITAGVGVCIH